MDTYEKSNHHPKSTIILFRSAIFKKDIITYHPLSAMAAEALLEGGGLVSTLGYHCTNIGVCVCKCLCIHINIVLSKRNK